MKIWSESKPSVGAHIQREDHVCKLKDIDNVMPKNSALGMDQVFVMVCGDKVSRRLVSLTCYYPNPTLEPVSCPTCIETMANPPKAPPPKKWTPPGKPWTPSR